MFNSRTLQGIIVLVIGVFLAVWLGLSIVTNQLETILQVTAAVVLIGCLFLGRKIWLLIPFAAALNLGFRIPGAPDSLLLAQILVLGFSALLFLMRKLPYQFAWTELEFWVLILTLFIFQVYVRNPVGVSLFGGDTVGGKGYALFAISLVAALLICGLRVPERELKWILPLSIFGGLLNAAVSIVGYLIPAVAFFTGAAFARSDQPNYENFGVAIDEGAATRIGFLTALSKNIALWVSSYISPLKACFHPLWAALILISGIAAVMGGFRNGVAALGLTYLIGIAYRSGFLGILSSSFIAISMVAMLGIANLIVPLPPNVQRSVAFLPGISEKRYKEETKESTEWRVEIWKEALLTERWIKNKWLGDGLGFSATELAAQMNARKGARVGLSGFDAQRENIFANGDYHSGPVSMIRTIGYAGLLAFLIMSFRLAVHAHRQIIRCKGTPWQPLALFIGIPIIWTPVFFLFIFGDFKASAAGFLMAFAFVRLLENNLPLPAYVKRSRVPYILHSGNHAPVKEPRLASGRR